MKNETLKMAVICFFVGASTAYLSSRITSFIINNNNENRSQVVALVSASVCGSVGAGVALISSCIRNKKSKLNQKGDRDE